MAPLVQKISSSESKFLCLNLIGSLVRLERSTRTPSAYLRRFTYDTISHNPDALRYLIRLVGADRVMLGSDYCFAIGYDRPVQVVTRLASLCRADQAKILGSNAARLLRLG